jgi:hypothetical protein
LKYLYENAEKTMSRIKGRGDIAACIYKIGNARLKQQHEILQNLKALHCEAGDWFDNRYHLFASLVSLENRFSWFRVTTSNACESTNIAFFPIDIWLYLTSVVRSMHV